MLVMWCVTAFIIDDEIKRPSLVLTCLTSAEFGQN
jgi:hypothetical protein